MNLIIKITFAHDTVLLALIRDEKTLEPAGSDAKTKTNQPLPSKSASVPASSKYSCHEKAI
jgi:hypothetical protein